MATPLSIMPPETTPSVAARQPLSIMPPKPFAATPLGIAVNTVRGIPQAARNYGSGLLHGDIGEALGDENINKSNTGIAINTGLGLPKAALDIGADIGRGLTRDAIGLGRTIANTEGGALDEVTGQRQAPAYPESAPLPKELQPIFGPDPVKVLPKQFQDMKDAIQNSSIAKKMGLDKVAGPLAFGGVLGQNLLDFAPLGGSEDAAIKQLTKETDPDVIAGLLRKTGVHPAIADKMAPHIAETTDPGEIKNALDIMKGSQAMHNETVHNESLNSSEAHPTVTHPLDVPSEHITSPQASELTPKAPEVAPKEPYVINAKGKDLTNIRNIIEDVKGYADPVTHDRIEIKNVGKTGETHTIRLEPPVPEVREMDIVRKEPIPVLRGGGPLDKAAITDKGISVTKDHETASTYAGSEIIKGGDHGNIENGKVHQLFLDPNAHILDAKQAPKELIDSYLKEGRVAGREKIVDWAKSNGYDGVDFTKFSDPEIRVLNPESLKTPQEVASSATEHATHAEEQSKYIDQLSKEKVDGKPIDKTPATDLHQLTSGKDGKAWESLVKGYSKNLPKDKKVNFLDYFGTPEFVLEKLGMQKGAELLQDAKDEYRLTLKKEIKTIQDWKTRIDHDPQSRPHSSERMFRYLNGDARYAKSEMTPTEIAVAGEIKTYLKGWADRLHLPADNRLGNYITHIFDKDAHGDLPPESVFDDPDLSVIMESTPARSVYNPFLEKRTNKPGYQEDVWGALDAYVKRGSRKEAMDPALEEISNMAHKLDDSAYSYVTRLTHRINMRPTEADELVDNFFKEHFGGKFTQRPTAYITGKIRSIFYRGTLGLNVASALRNLSQGANTYAKLGEKYTTIGYFKTLTHLVTRDFSELTDHGILDEGLNQDQKVGIYKSVLQKIDPVLFSLFNTAEVINRGAAYYGAKAQAMKKGLNPDEAIKYAKRMVRETQFAFGQVDSPVALSSDLVKTAAQMQSYNVKQIEFLTRMAKNKEYGGLIRYSLSSLVFLGTVGKLFGMTVDQLVPSIGIGSSPVGSAISGVAGEFSQNSSDRQKATSQLQRTFASLFPAGVQIRKTLQGLEAYGAGKDTTAKGKTRYTIPHNPQTLMQAALFGKSALPQAQKYYNKLNSKGTKKAPATSSGLSI